VILSTMAQEVSSLSWNLWFLCQLSSPSK